MFRYCVHIKRTPFTTMCGYSFKAHPNRRYPLPTDSYIKATCRTCKVAFEALAQVVAPEDLAAVVKE